MFRQKITSYDLRLDQSCIFVPETRNSPTTPSITGSFHVSFPPGVRIKSIKVKLKGMLHVPRDGFMIAEDRLQGTYEQKQVLASSKTLGSFPMPAGQYEFPFDIPLAGKFLETVTGVKHNYHSYTVEATVAFRYRRNVVVSKPVRIYHLSELETNYLTSDFSPTVGGTLRQKLQYSISMPSHYIPFGSRFPVDCQFTALSKDVRLVAVTVKIAEKHFIRLDATAAQSARDNIYSITSLKNHTVFSERFDIAAGARDADENAPCDSAATATTTATEWCLSKLACLPPSFDGCSQTVATKRIKISHKLVVSAEFQDAEGEIFTETTKPIPFCIYMTPSVIGQDGSICHKTIHDIREPPPLYGDHTLHPKLLGSSDDVDDGRINAARAGEGCGQLGWGAWGPAPCYDTLEHPAPAYVA
ncbi:uncharacterized protein BP01DRAFT_388319 [Aspergillus saccharolyticus JOP 1030-1]|uniref:Arrestin C-terminal-like domain-containing protein n=1 Tax=Aspergillus saccharolyticus JOP 1030-1 TaxID=1450539 RepID=A0A318ZNX9_9EURO|nr:hypothetical protein BP01DRAFT_388319 [Aspergillus saccharolyticus JOP 1030-1]PYH49246.1 hypothetical protein BP01DRAFT_388319 [Aspergillus saccharolyticus JOP 1030-1]